MFFALSKTLDLAFSPIAWALALFVAAALLSRRRTLAARALAAAALLTLYLPSTGLGARLLFEHVERFEGPRVRPGATYDAALLLGGFAGRRPDGAIEVSDAADRLLRTHELLSSGRARRAIVSGGRAEVEAIAELLERFGIERSRLVLEGRSLNTRQNALFIKPIVERERMQRLVVVTSAFHMQRALECLRAVGLSADALATDHQAPPASGWFDALAPRAQLLGVSERALRELAGRVVYRVQGYAR